MVGDLGAPDMIHRQMSHQVLNPAKLLAAQLLRVPGVHVVPQAQHVGLPRVPHVLEEIVRMVRYAHVVIEVLVLRLGLIARVVIAAGEQHLVVRRQVEVVVVRRNVRMVMVQQHGVGGRCLGCGEVGLPPDDEVAGWVAGVRVEAHVAVVGLEMVVLRMGPQVRDGHGAAGVLVRHGARGGAPIVRRGHFQAVGAQLSIVDERIKHCQKSELTALKWFIFAGLGTSTHQTTRLSMTELLTLMLSFEYGLNVRRKRSDGIGSRSIGRAMVREDWSGAERAFGDARGFDGASSNADRGRSFGDLLIFKPALSDTRFFYSTTACA